MRARNNNGNPEKNFTKAISFPLSSEKPDIPDLFRSKWKKVVDLVAEILNISVTMVTRCTPDGLTIIVAGGSKANVLPDNGHAELNTGITKKNSHESDVFLVVPDMQQSEYWKNHPLSGLGFNAYFGVPIEWEDGEIFGTFCLLNSIKTDYSPIIQDLLLQFKAIIENDLKCILLYMELKAHCTNQEMLIREANHRINNHLMLLISYVQLKASEAGSDRNIDTLLLDIQNRIKSISAIHAVLCDLSTGSTLPSLDEYLVKMCNSLTSNMTARSINCIYDIEHLELSVELSVSIGLVISELVTNSIKYAFTPAMSPCIEIIIHRIERNRIAVLYRDNGIGLPDDFDITRADTLGMSLIKLQIKQLHGELQINSKNGTEFNIIIDG